MLPINIFIRFPTLKELSMGESASNPHDLALCHGADL